MWSSLIAAGKQVFTATFLPKTIRCQAVIQVTYLLQYSFNHLHSFSSSTIITTKNKSGYYKIFSWKSQNCNFMDMHLISLRISTILINNSHFNSLLHSFVPKAALNFENWTFWVTNIKFLDSIYYNVFTLKKYNLT